MIKKVLGLVIPVILLGWGYVFISEYFRIKDGKDAKYCIENKIHEYDDGSVSECVGIGYKVYYYDRPNIGIKTEFGAFWLKIRE